MSRRTGRLKIEFAVIEEIAAKQLATYALSKARQTVWTLTRHSALYKRKDGSYTLSLIWHGSDGETLTSTIRNIRLEARA